MSHSTESDPGSPTPTGSDPTGAPPREPAGTAAGRDAEDPQPGSPQRVPITELIDLEAHWPGRSPTLREIRAALPRGWVLEPDGVTARRDLRLFFREGWILMLGLALFGTGGAFFFAEVLPSGWAGLGRIMLYIVVIVIAAGWVAPLITRALYRR